MPSQLVPVGKDDHRPRQKGVKLIGKSPAGNPMTKTVDALIDTGSDLCVVPKALADQFGGRPVAVRGTQARGVGGVVLVRRAGVKIQFGAVDPGGQEKRIEDDYDYLVGPFPRDGMCILGMHALVKERVEIAWDPKGRAGQLKVP
ncbi:MAG: aspartyl protease family protein [Actinomycetota bacterium]